MTFSPAISSKSQALAAQNEPLHQRASRLAREKEERLQQARAAQFSESAALARKAISPAGAKERVDSFMSWDEQRKAKLAMLKKAVENTEMLGCIFKPTTNSTMRPDIPKFEERLKEDQRKRQERIQNLQVSMIAKETAECTYKPVTNLSKKQNSIMAEPKLGKRKPLPIANPLSIDEIFSLAREN